MRRPQQGLGKLEFAVVLTILGVLAAVLLGRLTNVEREAERLEVALAVRNMRTGLKLAVGELIMHGEESRIADLLNENPLNFLGNQIVPQDAERSADDTASRSGEWMFSSATRELNYRPRQPEAFDGRKRLSWRLEGSRDARGRMLDLRLAKLEPRNS